tara:strand:- start:21 stop:884 length:864 start_codon:yes stop_codon:yes gene_type:complete
MANGIEDLSSVPAPNQSVIDMVIDVAAPSVTKIANNLGIPINDSDTKRIVKDGVVGGDSRVVLDIVNEKLTNVPNEVKSQLASELIAQAGMLTTPVGQLNALNATLQTGGDLVQSGLDFASSRLDPDGMGANVLGTTSDIIEGGQGIFGGMTNDANRVVGNLVINPANQIVGFAGRNVIDPLANRFNPLLNLFGKRQITPVFKPKPPVPQSFIDRQEEESRPVFTPPPATSNEAEVDYGGSGGGSGGSYGGGEDFRPPSGPSRPSGPDLRFRANGGLVAVSRYLKGR